MSGSILPQPYANCKLTSPDSSLQVSRDKQTDGPRRVTSWVMSDCESWSGVISIGPRETSRADVANSMEDSTRSKAQGIETFPDQSRPNPTHIANQPGLPELADTGLDWTEESSSLCRIGGPAPGGTCLLDLLRAACRFRPAFFPSPGTSIPALRAQSQPWNHICKSTHLPLWAATCRSLAPLAASLLPQQRRREGRLTAVAGQGQPLAHWPGTHYRSNLWECWQVQGDLSGGGQRLHSHRSSCWGDGNFLPSLTISIVKNHLVKSHSAYTGSRLPQRRQQNPRRHGLPAPLPPLAMCHSEPLSHGIFAPAAESPRVACRRICCASHCAGLGSMHLFPARWTPDTGPDWHWLWLSSIITVHTASFLLLVFLPHPRLAPPPASEHQQTSSRLSFHRARHTYLHYWRGA